MFPYRNRLQWHLKNRYHHLVAAVELHLHESDGVFSEVRADRIKDMKRALRVRGILLIMLSFGYLVTAGAWVARLLPIFDEVRDGMRTVASTLSTFAGILTILFLLATRWLGQLEADLIACLALDDHGRKRPGDP